MGPCNPETKISSYLKRDLIATIGNSIGVGIAQAIPGAVSLGRVSAGLARRDFYNLPLAAARAARYDAVVVMLGMNDAQPIAGARPGSDAWRN